VSNHISKTTAQTVHQRLNPELDICHTRRTTRFDFKNYSINAPHPAFRMIINPFVETISNQIHQSPPKICKGIDTTANTKARLMIAITTAFENQPLRYTRT
jgi:hypothetical protein